MADRRKKSLQKYHTDLRTGIIVSYFLPKLHREAGGFLTDVESETIAAKKSSGNVEQVDELIRVLLTKESKDFDYFCDVLEEEGHQSLSNRLKVAAGLSSDTPVACASVIPDIMDEYVRVKREFVNVCTTQGSPTLEEVKDLCIDLIECASKIVPRISCQDDDISKAKTFTELARVVCFRLSKWVSYDFFKKIVTHFQPALASVKEQLMHYEDQLKPFLLEKLENIAELQQREEAPGSMAELPVKYKLDADSLLLKDLVTERDFLAQRLGIPEHLLKVKSWGDGCIVITYWIVRDVLPLAELALCREGVRAQLTQHGVEEVYLDSHPSKHPGPVDQSLQTIHLQRRAIVSVLDAHCQHLDVPSLTSDLKGMGILTAEQCQKLASLDDERRHEALLYALLAHDGPDTYDKLVECMELRDTSIAADLQATLKDLMKSPGALSVISGSQYILKSPEERVVSQVMETMRSEEPLQVELRELLKEESLVEQAEAKKRLDVVMVPKEELEKLTQLECTHSKLQEMYSELQGRHSKLQEMYSELQGRHSKLQEMYSELQGRHRSTEYEDFVSRSVERRVSRSSRSVERRVFDSSRGVFSVRVFAPVRVRARESMSVDEAEVEAEEFRRAEAEASAEEEEFRRAEAEFAEAREAESRRRFRFAREAEMRRVEAEFRNMLMNVSVRRLVEPDESPVEQLEERQEGEEPEEK